MDALVEGALRRSPEARAGTAHALQGLRCHNIGWWDKDTLVLDAVGFVESFWLDRRGIPHTDKLHTTEKFTLLDSATMKYEATIDDPGAYTAPFTGGFNLRWEEGTELFEYVCQQANYAGELMVGQAESVNRSTPMVAETAPGCVPLPSLSKY